MKRVEEMDKDVKFTPFQTNALQRTYVASELRSRLVDTWICFV